jgi:hypothetical protein
VIQVDIGVHKVVTSIRCFSKAWQQIRTCTKERMSSVSQINQLLRNLILTNQVKFRLIFKCQGLVICTWFVFCAILITTWCTFDGAGKSWVKMKRYQANMKEFELKYPTYKRSGTMSRNWRQRYRTFG